jgi:protein gp37
MKITSIQWCDSTVNPIMGCLGCELFPEPKVILTRLSEALASFSPPATYVADNLQRIISEAYGKLISKMGYKKGLTSTNVRHAKKQFLEMVGKDYGHDAVKAVSLAYDRAYTCYAATQHLNKGLNIFKEERPSVKGYARTFEQVTPFPGRIREASEWSDLRGKSNPAEPWKESLPRLIFVSDMGDAFSRKSDFQFLKDECLPAFTSDAGKKHLWLWLTKRPETMAEFSDEISGFPANVCAMSTTTSMDTLDRIDNLRKVNASCKGLSIEPLRESIVDVDLTGIDWLILGGESGSPNSAPFEIEWALELQRKCEEAGVAFFLKQLGRNPTLDGNPIQLKDPHGGDWNEWPPEAPRVREFPKYFHEYRSSEPLVVTQDRPPISALNADQQAEFKKLDACVKKGAQQFLEVGRALIEIQKGKLYLAKFRSFKAYVADRMKMCRSHAYRFMNAAATVAILEAPSVSPDGDTDTPTDEGHEKAIVPESEGQIRPLTRFMGEPEVLRTIWTSALTLAGDGVQPTPEQIQEAISKVSPQTTRPPRKKLNLGEITRSFRKLRQALHARSLEDAVAAADELSEFLDADEPTPEESVIEVEAQEALSEEIVIEASNEAEEFEEALA